MSNRKRRITSHIKVGAILPTNNSGDVEVLSRSLGDLVIKFITTGNTRHCKVNALMNGQVKDLIYGVGHGPKKYSAKDENFKITKEYDQWRRLLYRCTPKWQEIHPSYKGCYVNDKWKYYDNFHEWCVANKPVPYWDLDKDLLKNGNKEYGENFCTFLPENINKVIVVRDNLKGCTYKRGRYEVYYRGVFQGSYKNKKEAQICYIEVKQKYINKLADTDEPICDQAREALRRFSIGLCLDTVVRLQ